MVKDLFLFQKKSCLQRNKAKKNFVEKKKVYISNTNLIVNFWKCFPKRKAMWKILFWTYIEVHLLDEIAKNFKAMKAQEGVDWESVKGKDVQILSIFVSNLSQEGSRREFLAWWIFTKDRIASKIKLLQNRCKNALDMGK